MRVGVIGAAGRMGTSVCRAIAADPDLELVAAVDPAGAGRSVAELTGNGAVDLLVGPDLSRLVDAGAEVAVDFSHIRVALETLRYCARSGVHAVVGTSGFGPDELALAAELFGGDTSGGDTSGGNARAGSHCMVVPNFAISAVLAVRFAELAAPWFETAEVVELHHDGKVDAPSGTAMSTAQRMGAARRHAGKEWAPDPTRDEVLPGARGGAHPSGVRIHSVRMRGMVAHEEIILGTTGQTLTIRQDSYDRESYMPGVLMAVKAVPRLPGLTVGLESVLGI